MKKTTIAAAKKAAKKAVKKAAVKKVAVKKAPAKKVSTPAPAPVKKAVVKKVTPKKVAPKKKAVKKSLPKTTIVANVDIGFGNTLFLRGSAPGFSWSTGVPMDCADDSSWTIDIAGVVTAFEFKVLINDEYWCAGYNDVAEPGFETTITPSF